MYDYLIIGGGISGLYCALKLMKHNKNICLCEKYSNLGGRVVTYNDDGYQWEIGAGRISKQHKLVLKLMKKYKQPLINIGSNVSYKRNGKSCYEPNLFENNLQTMILGLKDLDKKVLANKTIRELCYEIHGKEKTDDYLSRFPYKAEIDVMRADLALESFSNEMGTHEGYYVAKNGLSALIDAMKNDFINNKAGTILTKYKCVEIKESNEKIICKFENNSIIETKKLILALESENLKKIPLFKNLSFLKHIKMEPLLRTYGVFENCWFSQLPRVVTQTSIRYFLPINYEKSIAMVSYTDSTDTNKYHNILKKYGEDSLGNHIYNNLKELFGNVSKQVYFKAHYWKYGASYWIPGDYDPKEESIKSLKPFDSDIYLIGESYSLRQAWIEGALEQVEKLFHTYRL